MDKYSWLTSRHYYHSDEFGLHTESSQLATFRGCRGISYRPCTQAKAFSVIMADETPA